MDVSEYWRHLVAFGHAGWQVGMVNHIKRQNAQLVAQKEDAERQVSAMKERGSRLNVQIQELDDTVRAL